MAGGIEREIINQNKMNVYVANVMLLMEKELPTEALH